jgi:DNA helicase-2/ATP-dependent DNA helicase PcrA
LEVDFSSLVTYSECGYKYWLRHVCGFQPPLVTELGFGKLLHHVVAELARKAAVGEQLSEGDVDRIVEDSFYLPFASAVPAANLRESIRRRVGSYFRKHAEELPRAIQPEARFEVPLEGARVRGRIDLLLRANGGNQVELVDFKTSATGRRRRSIRTSSVCTPRQPRSWGCDR